MCPLSPLIVSFSRVDGTAVQVCEFWLSLVAEAPVAMRLDSGHEAGHKALEREWGRKVKERRNEVPNSQRQLYIY